MGDENKPKNPLDEFWAQIGDKKKKYVRSYRPNKRDIQTSKRATNSNGNSGTNPRKRRD
tara:strand:+ start:102 stop:278 length:177 start_codon:yes stop_codon:yes gene_type:complete